MDEQLNLELPMPTRRRRKMWVAIESDCPVDHVPQGLSLDILNAKTFYCVHMDMGLPVRDGFYGLISEAETGNYRGMAWFETKTGIWWDVGSRKPMNPKGLTSWYGLTAELGGRRRRKLLQPLN